MDITPFFRKSDGFNNKVNKIRLPFDPKSGNVALSTAVNIQHDSTGQPRRRLGYSTLLSGPYHSVYGIGGDGLCVISGDLYLVRADLSLKGLRAGLTDVPMYYVTTNQGIFYSNGYENGVVKNEVSSPWPVQSYKGPTTSRQFSSGPIGTHLELFNGRMLIAAGRYVYYSEPWAFGLFALDECYWPFSTPVKMIKTVDGGVYVSDSSKVTFLKGKDISKLEPKVVSQKPAFEGSVLPELIQGFKLGVNDPGYYAIWGSQDGFMAGGPDGNVYNLTDSMYDPPAVGTRGASIFTGYDIIQCIF
jgi:hypothetical protein